MSLPSEKRNGFSFMIDSCQSWSVSVPKYQSLSYSVMYSPSSSSLVNSPRTASSLTWKHTYKNQHVRKETADLTRELFRVLFFGEISDWSRITRNMVHQRNRRILTPDWILRFPWCNMIRVILDWSVLRFSQRNVPPLAHPDIYVTSACKCSPRKLSNITGIEKSWEFSWIFLRIF